MVRNINIIFVSLVLVALLLAGCSKDIVQENVLAGNVVALVNNEPITEKEVLDVQQLFASVGQDISQEQILEELINQKILFQKAELEGFTITTQEAEEFIITQLSVQGISLEEYKEELITQELVYADQLKVIKEDLSIQQYIQEAFQGKDFSVTQEEALAVYTMVASQSGDDLPSFEEVEADIMAFLSQQKQQEALTLLISELREDTTIIYN